MHLHVHVGVLSIIVFIVAASFVSLGWKGFPSTGIIVPANAQASLTVSVTSPPQVIDGFGAAIGGNSAGDLSTDISTIVEAAVNDLGLSIVRVGEDFFHEFEQCHCVCGAFDAQGKCTACAVPNQCTPNDEHTWLFIKQNDNADPYAAEPGFFEAKVSQWDRC